MGSSQSIISQEAVITVAVVAAVGFGYSKFGPSATTSNTLTGAETSGKKGKKNKKASVPSPASEPSVLSPPTPIVVPFPVVIPGGFDGTITPEPEVPLSERSGKSKKKKKTRVANSATLKQPYNARPPQTESKVQASGSTPSTDKDISNSTEKRMVTVPPSTSTTSSPKAATTRQLNKVQSSVSIDTDGSWTRVESHRTKSGRSVDNTTTSASEADPATGTSSPVVERMEIEGEADIDDDDRFFTRSLNPEERRPLAERMLPRPRKTGVESMLEAPDHPTLSRVMRVSPHVVEQPALGFSWGDYEDAHDADVDGEDDNGGWDVVKSRRTRTIHPSTSEPSPSQTKQKKIPETLSKRQRQNAARRETQKALKEEAEHQRRATLARHQRELENERMKEQTRGRAGKKVSGGMKAVVSDTGKFVWE